MTTLHELAVERFRTLRVPNRYPGTMTWRLFHKVRNAIVRTCRRHGPTGPMGVFPLTRVMDTDNWNILDDDPIYWIIDDQYNDEAYQYMEFVDSAACTDKWLEDLTATLSRFPEWGIGVNSLKGGYLLIFADKLLVKGPLFRGCRDAASVTRAIRARSASNQAI